jgi:predicted dehydrogenase
MILKKGNNGMKNQKIRMGMVGGGSGAFIGQVHRMAANLDGQIELVCGAFSSDKQRSISSGQDLYLDESRCYANYQEMFEKEAQLPSDERMQFVSIVTPNHLHFDVAKLALENGFHVLSDKPATFSLEEVLALEQIISKTQKLYGLTHTYTGYPLVKQAKHLVANGELGKVTKVAVQYSQGWLSKESDTDNKQAAWRLDPSRAGISCCVGDIGVHAFNLLEYISGLEVEQMCSELTSVVDGRALDDDATILVKLNNGAKGVVGASQIAVGDENDLAISVYGEKASLTWRQQEPNSLWLKYNDKPAQMIRAGVGEFCEEAQMAMRTPAGHPEGYLEAFANLYLRFAQQVRAFPQAPENLEPVLGIEAAVRGMAFIENSVTTSQSNTKWHTFNPYAQKTL